MMHLGVPKEHHIEYARFIMVARLLWSRWHEGTPPQAFQEEPCEALLRRVVHRLACNAGATSFEQCFDEFLPVSPASTEERDRLHAGIPANSVPLVERNVRGLIQAVRQDIVPFARCSAKKLKVPVSWVWPGDFLFWPATTVATYRPLPFFGSSFDMFTNTGFP